LHRTYYSFLDSLILSVVGRSSIVNAIRFATLRFHLAAAGKHTAPDQDQAVYRPEPRHSARVHTPGYLNNTQEYAQKGQSLCLNAKNNQGLGQTKCVLLSDWVSRN